MAKRVSKQSPAGPSRQSPVQTPPIKDDFVEVHTPIEVAAKGKQLDVGSVAEELAKLPDAGELSPFILIMGEAKSRRASFVRTMAPEFRTETDGWQSGSGTPKTPIIFPLEIGRMTVNLIYIPGFNDSIRSHVDILLDTSRILVALNRAGGQLKGIIYIHDLTAGEFSEGIQDHITTLRHMCGEKALKNLHLVTSGWNSRALTEDKAREDERKLYKEVWGTLAGEGATIHRFKGTRDSAEAIIAQCAHNRTVPLRLQEQILASENLTGTSAGYYARIRREKMLGMLEPTRGPNLNRNGGWYRDNRGVRGVERAVRVSADDERKVNLRVTQETDNSLCNILRSEDMTVLGVLMAFAVGG
ncbi:hypothetical protein ABW19_dt0201270 [Dactylella cylindrospora]|nr:hypothetical protein ABW19_dt0201270 [Dactylella cylindrospora]